MVLWLTLKETAVGDHNKFHAFLHTRSTKASNSCLQGGYNDLLHSLLWILIGR